MELDPNMRYLNTFFEVLADYRYPDRERYEGVIYSYKRLTQVGPARYVLEDLT